jgi:hypothetical protein
MTAQTTHTARVSPVDAVAADLLRDVAFALRMARKVSAEIRRDATVTPATMTRVGQEHWKLAGGSATLGA